MLRRDTEKDRTTNSITKRHGDGLREAKHIVES
jgi:hypothetical protein